MRELNTKQVAKLERMETTNAEAQVIGWIDNRTVGRGPVVRVRPCDERLLNVTGFLKKI